MSDTQQCLCPGMRCGENFPFFIQISKEAIEKQRKAGMKDLNGTYILVQGVHLFEKSARIGKLFVLWGWENGVEVPR